MTDGNYLTEEAAKALRAPFPDAVIGHLPRKNKSGGVVYLDYVGHAATTDRLLQVDPEWTWEPVAYDDRGLPAFDREGGLWIRLTVCGVTRLGYGDAQGKSGNNAVKEAIGDALRNAAMRFGVALDLWAKEDLHGATITEPDEPGVVDPTETEMRARREARWRDATKWLDEVQRAAVKERWAAAGLAGADIYESDTLFDKALEVVRAVAADD